MVEKGTMDPNILGMTHQRVIRNIADEPHWNRFVVGFGGELVAPLIKSQGVQNADYLFREERVIVELKTLQTEFFDPLLVRIGETAKALCEGPTEDAFVTFERRLFGILEAPLARIVKKANRQIRETKDALGLQGHRGIVLCINDGFIGFPPFFVTDLLHRILVRERFSSTHALIYMTNHVVRVNEGDHAGFLWWPYVGPKDTDELKAFIDRLGEGWARFASVRLGQDEPVWVETRGLRGARIVGSPTPSS